jgi:hypothetical protein
MLQLALLWAFVILAILFFLTQQKTLQVISSLHMNKLNFNTTESTFKSSVFTSEVCGLCRKLILLTGCVILLLNSAYSQNTELPFKAAIAIGPSFPVGKFNETTIDSSTINNAVNPGPSIIVSFSYHFKQSFFGVEILGGIQGNTVNVGAIARKMAEGLPDGSEVAVKSDNWHIWKVLGGPTFEIPFSKDKKTSFVCDLLGGILKTGIPGYEYGSTFSNPPMSFFAEVSKIPLPTSFCYQADAGIKHSFTKFWSISGNLGFTHASPVYSYTLYLDPPYFQEPVHMNRIYPISTINLLVGVGYAF